MFSFRPSFLSALLILSATPMLAIVPAQAQIGSDSYQFLKAVRDADGTKATELLSEPGSRIVDTKDYTTGEAAIHIVVLRRDLSWLGFLIGKNARTDIRDKQGNTALILAARLGFAEGAELLLARKARVDDTNSRGETALILATQNRDTRMVRMLLAAGANPDRADTLAGQSARDYATNDPRNAAVLRLIQDAKKPAIGAAIAGPK